MQMLTNTTICVLTAIYYFGSQYNWNKGREEGRKKNTYLENMGLKCDITTFVGIVNIIFVLPFLSLFQKAVYNKALTTASIQIEGFLMTSFYSIVVFNIHLI